MKSIHALAAAGFSLAALFASTGSMAQVQLNVCGVPGLPPCADNRPVVRERTIIERRGVERLSSLCRTRTLRCRTDEPAPIGSRCTCEDEDGEEVIGRVR